MKKGTIFDIKELAVFDGPGIRQTVFFKGCPLRCNWCHNPEGLSAEPELMVSLASCTKCGKCKTMCKQEKCNCCGACISVCPLNLRRIAGETVTSEELEKKIRKDSEYYSKYNGGITFSGGEPLLQLDFLNEVLERISDLHKALETSGYCGCEDFKKVALKMDYIMIDLKIFDAKMHKKYTGVDNRKILENIKFLCDSNIPFVVRIPLIPDVNDNEFNFRKTAEWIRGSKSLIKVELLPYHKTAGAKYSMVNKEYKPIFDTEKVVWTSHRIFEEYGIRSEIV